MLKHWPRFLTAVSLALSACRPLSAPPAPGAAADPDAPAVSGPETPARPAYQPQPEDAALARGEVFLDVKDLLILESDPPQIVLALAGSLPTPCHQLRAAVAPPDAQNRIAVDVYTVVDPDAVCVQMLQGFEQSLALGAFPAGVYTVWVNGELTGEFTS